MKKSSIISNLLNRVDGQIYTIVKGKIILHQAQEGIIQVNKLLLNEFSATELGDLLVFGTPIKIPTTLKIENFNLQTYKHVEVVEKTAIVSSGYKVADTREESRITSESSEVVKNLPKNLQTKLK